MIAAAPQRDGREEVSLEASTAWLHLFGDATRLRLLALLEEHELSVAELVAITELPQSRVSTHLGRLREAGLVHDRRAGASSLYRVNAAMPPAASTLWRLLRTRLEDATLRADATRREALLAARDADSWSEAVAGEMERHWSPGRTWEALVHGLSALLSLGDVLDVGCGDGWTARLIAPQARSYTGVDRSDKVLAAAARRTQGLENVTLVPGEMRALPFDDASFDQVLLFHVLTHADDPQRALHEAARVTRAGGRVVIVSLAAHAQLALTAPYGHRHAGFSPRTLRSMLRAAGLEPRRCEVTSRERKAPHFEALTAIASPATPTPTDAPTRASKRKRSR